MFLLFYKDHKQAVLVLINIVVDKCYDNDRVSPTVTAMVIVVATKYYSIIVYVLCII